MIFVWFVFKSVCRRKKLLQPFFVPMVLFWLNRLTFFVAVRRLLQQQQQQ